MSNVLTQDVQQKLKEFLEKSNGQLLSDFKFGWQGAYEFNIFMNLVRKELQSKDH